MKTNPRPTKKVADLLFELSQTAQKGIAWLIDPDEYSDASFTDQFWEVAHSRQLELILVGGSQDSERDLDLLIQHIRSKLPQVPICLFPGSELQISDAADAILFMSLLSGRNPEYLIGQQVKAIPKIKESNLEILPTAYLLVNDGDICSVHRKSGTFPLVNNELSRIVDTAMAGKYLGMDFCYLDAGSGSASSVAVTVIEQVKESLAQPLLVGGGLDNLQKIQRCYDAGADLVVIGNSVQKDPGFLAEVLDFKCFYNKELHIN